MMPSITKDPLNQFAIYLKVQFKSQAAVHAGAYIPKFQEILRLMSIMSWLILVSSHGHPSHSSVPESVIIGLIAKTVITKYSPTSGVDYSLSSVRLTTCPKIPFECSFLRI